MSTLIDKTGLIASYFALATCVLLLTAGIGFSALYWISNGENIWVARAAAAIASCF